jgi:hypothetical protein
VKERDLFNRFFGEKLMTQNPINKLNLIRATIRKTNALKAAQIAQIVRKP